MSTLQTCVAALLALLTSPLLAQSGLTVDAKAWPRWQTRLSLEWSEPIRGDFRLTTAQLPRLRSASVLQDYYFATPSFDSIGLAGGFRATRGLLLSSRRIPLSLPSTPHALGLTTTPQQSFGLGGSADAFNPAESMRLAPYVGLGYTGLSTHGGWGFSADVGLMAWSPGSGLNPGRLQPGFSGFDDTARDFRITPVLQVGVSYSF